MTPEESAELLKICGAKYMAPEEALLVGIESAQITARKLERLWIERERELRNIGDGRTETLPTKESNAIQQCRRELQKAFHLTFTPEEAELPENNV